MKTTIKITNICLDGKITYISNKQNNTLKKGYFRKKSFLK